MSGAAVALASALPAPEQEQRPLDARRHAAGVRRDEESRWLAAVCDGDPDAMQQLWQRYRLPCLRLARRTLGADTHTEDVVQLVFLDIWRHAQRFDPARATAGSWILSMAHHKSVDRVRHEQRRSALAVELREEVRTAAASVDDIALDVLRRQTVRLALDSLCAPQREVLLLAYFGDRTYVEIAALLHLPLGTVKSRGRIGLQALRARLAELGEADASD